MAEASPQLPTPAASTSCEALPVEIARANCPANSDGTDRMVVAPERPRTMDVVPSARAAIFSTGDGRRAAREPPGPPFPPVIVRSDKVMGVVQYANYWRNEYPKLYHVFFPNSGWTINDLWDNADIHLESPSFLEEVLLFITRDNDFRAKQYGFEWSKVHRDKLDIIGGDMTTLYDPNNPAAIVDKIFTDGETDHYPHLFLWHVAYHIRYCMSVTVKKQQAVKAAADALGVVKADGEAAGSTKPGPSSATDKPAIIAHAKQPQSASSPGVGLHHLQAAAPLVPSGLAPIMNAPPGPSGPPPRGPSFGSSQSVRGYSHQSNGYPMGQHAVAVPPYPNGQLRNHKNRPARSASNAHTIPPQAHGWADNISIPHGQHVRQPSGPVPPGQAQHFVQHIPMGSSMIAPNLMPQFPHNGSLMSPQMHPIQVRYSPTLQQNMVPQHAAYMPHPMDAAFHQFGPDALDQHGMPFGDITNNVQYPPPRGMDPRGLMPRRPSYANKPSGLYNPYGTERPDKAGFAMVPSQPNVRKTRHNSFSNNPGRGRKYSASFGAQPFEREGNMRPNGHYGDAPYPRVTYTHVNQDIVDDLDAGCCQDRIGPKNNTVFELHVKNLPPDVTKEELGSFFQQRSKVQPRDIALKSGLNPDHITHAFVHFSSTAEARQGLQANSKLLRERALAVSVPNRYWKYPDASTQLFEGQIPDFRAHGSTRMPSTGSHSTTENTVTPMVVQYSPQDARSGLRRISQKQQECLMTQGSPEARKSKKHTSTSRITTSRNEEKPRIDEVNDAADKLDIIPELPASIEPVGAQQPTPVESVSKQQPTLGGVVNVQQFTEHQAIAPNPISAMASSEQDVVPDAAPSVVEYVAEETGVEIPEMETSEPAPLDDTQSESTIIVQLIPSGLDSSPCLSAAKVALPPVVDHLSKAAEKTSASQNAAVEKEKAGDSQPRDTIVTVRHQEDTASDDDQKNDLSFHSAQESHSDSEQNERNAETISLVEVDEAPHACVISDMTLTEPQQAGPEPASENFAVIGLNSGGSQQVELKTSTTGLDKASSDAAKKPGAKQTQSLFPWAKPSKSQAKKERQAKKKDKRKEKEKGKPEKVVPTPTSTKELTVTDAELPVLDGQPKLEVQPELMAVSEVMIVSAPSSPRNNHDKKDPKNTEPSSIDATISAVINDRKSEKVESKHALFLAKVVPVTQKREAQQEAMQTRSGNPSLETPVLCPNELLDAVSLPESGPIMLGLQHSTSKEEPVAKTKAALHRIAVPNLTLLKRRPSPTRKVSAVDTISSGISPTESSEDALGMTSINNDSGFVAVSLDAASVGSSPTLRAPSPPPPISASPTTSNFYTPVQTPSALGPAPSTVDRQPNEPSKKKKSKKKKKTGPKLNETANETSTSKEPFHDQFSEIDGIKTANQSKSYYSRSSKEHAEKESRSEEKDSRNLFRTVHAYVKGKVDTYARLPEQSWSADDWRKATPMAPREVEGIINNDEAVIVKALAEDSQLPDDDPKKVNKAGVRPIFHD